MKTPTSVQEIVDAIQPLDQEYVRKAQEHTAQLVMPPRALGRMHELSEKLCGITRTLEPKAVTKAILVMAGDHGIVDEGVSAFPQVVTGEMVRTFLRDGAGINVLARHEKARVRVVDMGMVPDVAAMAKSEAKENGPELVVKKIAPGTANFAKGPAMTTEQTEQAVLAGFELAGELFTNGTDIIGTGDMGIGNTTPSAAIGAVITGTHLDVMVGRGTGVDDEGLERKKAAIQKGIDVNKPDAANGMDVLAKVGGFEIAGIAGICLAGAYYKKPVMVDGFISTAGALIAQAINSDVTDYLFSGHKSEEPGHEAMLTHLGLDPVLDLGMRLGEGTGGVMAMHIIEAATKIQTEMLTFAQAGVSEE